MGECQGNCEHHSGEVVRVHVTDGDNYDWGKFNYCETAISTDRTQGLLVNVLKDHMGEGGDR